MWFNREIGRTFVYYDDGDSKQWIETVPAGAVDTNTIAGYVNPVFASMNGAYTTANAAYGQANTFVGVYGVANAAFGKANTALANTSGVSTAGGLNVTGNLGVGTITPSSKLDVVGVGATIRVADDQSTSGTLDLSANSTAAIINANYWGSAVPLMIKTGGSERMRIDTSGNLLFNSGYGSAATAYGCRAWITYDGVNLSIKGSAGITSVSRSATGQFQYNLSFTMPDTNYAVVTGWHNSDGGAAAVYPGFTNNFVVNFGWAFTTTAFRAATLWGNNVWQNPYWVSHALFR
jgi:hypothetical protein